MLLHYLQVNFDDGDKLDDVHINDLVSREEYRQNGVKSYQPEPTPRNSHLSLQDLWAKRCGECKMCMRDDCGKCKSCLSNKNCSNQGVCLHKVRK